MSSSHARKGFKLLEKYFENTDLPIALAVAGRPISRKDYKNICYVGYEKNMAALYAQTDFSILASIYEPFGLVPIESLCMGVPVAISENLGCKDYISKAVKEEFNPFSIDCSRQSNPKLPQSERFHDRSRQKRSFRKILSRFFFG